MLNEGLDKFQNSFFLISSKDLESVETELFGFAIEDNKVIVHKEDIDVDKLDGTGVYCYVLREGNEISIYQDFGGCYGLYVYQDINSDFFAVSNSFLKLVEYLKEEVPLTVDFDYAKSFIPVTLVSFAYERTLINEIKLINKNQNIKINIDEKSISYDSISYGEKSVELESVEALNILDKWFNKWVGILNNLYSKTDNITLELSGGFDTRIILALTLATQMDLNNINVYSSEAQDATKMEDLKITKKISQHFNFKLNKGLNVKKNYFDNIEEPIMRSLNSKLGSSKLMYWQGFSYDSNVFILTGFGGEGIKRVYINDSIESLIMENMTQANAYSSELANSSRVILEEEFDRFSELNEGASLEELFNMQCLLVRNRLWGGRNASESLLFNKIKLNPLFDPLINSLDMNIGKEFILPCLVYLRYCPDLLNFEFEGEREIPQDTLEYAKKVNSIYPFKLDDSNKEKISRKIDSKGKVRNQKPKYSRKDFTNWLIKGNDSEYFKKLFLMYFPREVYDAIHFDSKKLIRNLLAMVSILKVIEDSHYSQIKFNNSAVGWFNSCLDESSNVLVEESDEDNNIYSKLLTKYLIGRIDIKNAGVSDNDIIINSVSDEKAEILRPNWFATKTGHGTQIESDKCSLDIKFTCVNDGRLKIALRSKDSLDKNKKRLPIFIDFKNFKVDSELIFDKSHVVSVQDPYVYFKNVKDGQEVNMHVEWSPLNKNSHFKE